MQPGLIVFDLDFTLWDCGGLWVDCTRYPFSRLDDGSVIDSDGKRFRLYPDVLEIMDELDEKGIQMGVASRTDQPTWALELLELWGVKKRFPFREIYPGSKVTHFRRLAEESGVALEEMVFFDDEARNIIEVGALGVHCHHVRNGLSREVFDGAIREFSQKA